jgi:hypothetical protein
MSRIDQQRLAKGKSEPGRQQHVFRANIEFEFDFVASPSMNDSEWACAIAPANNRK